MGNSAGSLKNHLETAEKTGALSFSERKLEKFPPELNRVCGNLRNLDLSGNRLQQLPPSLGTFKMLKTLNLARNRILSLPPEMENLVKLENINLSFNALTAVPGWFQKLKNLKELNLSNNQISVFPVALCGLKHMNTINLASNRITQIPEGVAGLEATEVILNQNQVSNISEDLANCPRLKTLRLEENCLALEAIPSNLLSSSGVSLLAVEGNLFDIKKLDSLPGYEEYMNRYTAVKRKLD